MDSVTVNISTSSPIEDPQFLTLSKITFDDKFVLLVLFAVLIAIFCLILVIYLKDKQQQQQLETLAFNQLSAQMTAKKC